MTVTRKYLHYQLETRFGYIFPRERPRQNPDKKFVDLLGFWSHSIFCIDKIKALTRIIDRCKTQLVLLIVQLVANLHASRHALLGKGQVGLEKPATRFSSIPAPVTGWF